MKPHDMKTTRMALLIVITVQTHRSSSTQGSLMNRESHATRAAAPLISSLSYLHSMMRQTSKCILYTTRVESNLPFETTAEQFGFEAIFNFTLKKRTHKRLWYTYTEPYCNKRTPVVSVP
jgi:hypothetical protein